MHDLIAKLTEMLNLTPEQQFKVAAMIKRNIHSEKHSVYHRYFLYSQGIGIFDKTDPENPILIGKGPAKDAWLNSILEERYKAHAKLALLPDEELVTWNVGSHIYK